MLGSFNLKNLIMQAIKKNMRMMSVIKGGFIKVRGYAMHIFRGLINFCKKILDKISKKAKLKK